MSKKILAFILAACMTLSMTACGGSDSSDAETQSSSFSESESSETDSSENDSSETDSSEDESSEVEKVTTKTPKKVEDSSSEDDNSSKVTTTTKKTETPKTTTTKTTQAPVTQKPATTTKTTTKTTTHTHRWVKQWDDGNGTIFYWCPDCFAEKYDHYTVTTTTKTQPTSKTIKSNEWIPVYNKTFVTHTIGDGYTFHYDPKTQQDVPDKKVEFVSKTYWNEAAANRGDATEIAKRDKANAEAKAFMSRKDLMNKGWVSSGNDHYIDVPDKYNIAFYYYKDSNGKYAVWWGSNKPSVMTESDLAKSEAYQNASTVKTNFKNAYFTGTPWA